VQFARAQQWESLADTQDVVSFFDPADDRVTQAPDMVPGRILEDERGDEEAGYLRA
jgi:hypothetical protein